MVRVVRLSPKTKLPFVFNGKGSENCQWSAKLVQLYEFSTTLDHSPHPTPKKTKEKKKIFVYK